MILNNITDINAKYDGNTALALVVKHNYHELAELILRRFTVDVNSIAEAIFIACKENHVVALNNLIIYTKVI